MSKYECCAVDDNNSHQIYRLSCKWLYIIKHQPYGKLQLCIHVDNFFPKDMRNYTKAIIRSEPETKIPIILLLAFHQ